MGTPVTILSAHVSAHILVGVGVGKFSLGNEVIGGIIDGDEVIPGKPRTAGTQH